MASIRYKNDDGKEVTIDMTGKTVEQIDSLATKIKFSLPHPAHVDVEYEGATI